MHCSSKLTDFDLLHFCCLPLQCCQLAKDERETLLIQGDRVNAVYRKGKEFAGAEKAH